MSKGTVKRVRIEGYGFIQTPDSPDKDIFFHVSNLTPDLAARGLREGDEVEFKILDTPKGKNATDIKLVGAEAQEATQDEASEPMMRLLPKASEMEDDSTEVASTEDTQEDDSDMDDQDMQKAA